jgi:hypothetical protein
VDCASVEAVKAPGREAEPEMSKGWVAKAEGGGTGEGDVLAALVAVQEALSRAKLSASNLFSNFNPSYLRMGQLRVLWSVLCAELWQRRHLFTFVLNQGFPPTIEIVVERFCHEGTIRVCCVWVNIRSRLGCRFFFSGFFFLNTVTFRILQDSSVILSVPAGIQNKNPVFEAEKHVPFFIPKTGIWIPVVYSTMCRNSYVS